MSYKFGILRNGQPLPNVTVTTFSSDTDVVQATQSHVKRVETGKKSALDKSVFATTFTNMRQRYADQGAEQVRYFPV